MMNDVTRRDMRRVVMLRDVPMFQTIRCFAVVYPPVILRTRICPRENIFNGCFEPRHELEAVARLQLLHSLMCAIAQAKLVVFGRPNGRAIVEYKFINSFAATR